MATDSIIEDSLEIKQTVRVIETNCLVSEGVYDVSWVSVTETELLGH